MGLFKPSKSYRDLWDALEDVRRVCESLRADNKQLRLEWDETFDKIRRLTSRLAKRDAIDARNAEPPPPGDGAAENHGIDPISAKIHARRAMGRKVG